MLKQFAEESDLEYEIEGPKGCERVTFIRKVPRGWTFFGKKVYRVEKEQITLPQSIEFVPAIGLGSVPIPYIKGLHKRLARDLIGFFLPDYLDLLSSLEFSKRQPELPTRAYAHERDNLDPQVVR